MHSDPKQPSARRSNFALPEEITDMLRDMQDKHQSMHGFRPAMTQIVEGLIRQAHEKDHPHAQ